MNIFKSVKEINVFHQNGGKTQKEIIEEIHNAFDTEVDKLLKEAKIKREEKPIDDNVVNKGSRLASLGFHKSKVVKERDAFIDKKKEDERFNREQDKMRETIEYFSFKYPNYKFITEESVNKICDKYGLIYGDVSNYIGDVPEKNLQDIENFEIDKEDACYMHVTRRRRGEEKTPCDYKMIKTVELEKEEKERIARNYFEYTRFPYPGDSIGRVEKCPLMIAAPFKEFDTDNMELDGNQLKKKSIKIDDPVVLQPVHRNGERYFLVVTAWGAEAEDELVVNQKMN